MPRKKRIWELHKCHHVMLRGIRGQSIFSDSADNIKFCLLLQEASERHCLRIHAFCLMSNHIHLILEPTKKALTDGVHYFAFRYAQYFNKRHSQCGYVFQGRFQSILVQDDLYLRRLIRYIHLNPIEAGMAKSPSEYIWSSHNAYFGNSSFTWLHTDRILSYFGEARNIALENLAEFIDRQCEARVDIKEIHKATRIGVYGTDEFVNIYAPDAFEINKKSLSFIEISIENWIEKVNKRFNVSLEDLSGSSKSKILIDARSVLAHGSKLIEGGSLGDICRILGKHHGTVSRLALRATKSQKLTDIVHELLENREN
jgi:putative transposase